MKKVRPSWRRRGRGRSEGEATAIETAAVANWLPQSQRMRRRTDRGASVLQIMTASSVMTAKITAATTTAMRAMIRSL